MSWKTPRARSGADLHSSLHLAAIDLTHPRSLKNWGHVSCGIDNAPVTGLSDTRLQDSVKALDEENDNEEGDRKDKSGDSSDQPEEARATKVDEGETEVPQARVHSDDSKEPNLKSSELPEDDRDEEKRLDEGTDGKKRKLDDDEPAAAAAEADVDNEVDIPDQVSEDREADKQERPRKKSKVNGGDDFDTAA